MIDPMLVNGIQPPPSYLQSMAGVMTLRGLMQQRQMNAQSMEEGALKLQQLRQQLGDDAAMRAYFLSQYGQQAQDGPQGAPQGQPAGQMPPQASVPPAGAPLSQIGALQQAPAQPQTADQVMAGPVFSPLSQIGAAAAPASQTVSQPAAQQPLPSMGGKAGKTAVPPGVSYEDAAQAAFGRGDYRGGQALLQAALARREALTKIGLDTAHTGEYAAQGQHFGAETAKMRAEALANGIGSVLQLPPDQQAAGHTAMLQQLVSQGVITPEQAQAEAQFPGAEALQQHYATLVGPAGLNRDAKGRADASEANSKATQAALVTHGMLHPEDATAQRLALTPEQRVSIDARLQEIGKLNTPAELAYQASNTALPAAQREIANAALQRLNQYQKAGRSVTSIAAPQLSPEAIQMLADNYAKSGNMPVLGRNAGGAIAQVLNNAAKQGPAGAPPPDIAGNRANYKADSGSLAALQKNRDQVAAFENTALKNLDQFLGTAQKVVDTGHPVINAPLRMINNKMLGDTEVAAFNTARQVAVTEIAKVLSNPGMSGQLSDSARHEVQGLIGPDATLKQIYTAARILKTDMKNRADSMDQQIGDIKGRIGGGAAHHAPVTHVFNPKTGMIEAK